MSAILHPGLYTIQQVISRDEGIFAYASARRHPGAPLVGSPDLSPEFIQHWRVSVVNGGNNTYAIEAEPGQGLPPLGWSIEPVEPVQPGNPVILTLPAREFRIQHVAEESKPDEQAFSIMVPINTGDTPFYIQQSLVLLLNPPIEVVEVFDPSLVPIWIFKRV